MAAAPAPAAAAKGKVPAMAQVADNLMKKRKRENRKLTGVRAGGSVVPVEPDSDEDAPQVTASGGASWKDAAEQALMLQKALIKEPAARTEEDCNLIYNMLSDQRVVRTKSEYVKRQLCRMVQYEKHEPGHAIVKEGEVGDKFYMILSGIVDIYVDAVGRDAVTAMTPGKDFGEAALLKEDARRNATCRARGWVELVTLDRQGYNQVMRLGDSHTVFFERLGYPNLDTDYTYLRVELQGRDLGEQGGALVCDALMLNERANWVNIGGNAIGALGGERLAAALKINQKIKTLHAPGNVLGDAGATSVGEALKTNKILKRFDLRYNSIGCKGAAGLSTGLRKNKVLETIDLSKNNIGDDGAVALAEALKKNRTLIRINLEENPIGERGILALIEMQKKNTYVTVVGFRYKREYPVYF